MNTEMKLYYHFDRTEGLIQGGNKNVHANKTLN